MFTPKFFTVKYWAKLFFPPGGKLKAPPAEFDGRAIVTQPILIQRQLIKASANLLAPHSRFYAVGLVKIRLLANARILATTPRIDAYGTQSFIGLEEEEELVVMAMYDD
jgi:hypothetical protein